MRLPAEKYLPLAALIALTACGGGVRPHDSASVQTVRGGPSADYPMVLGVPYTIDGVTYTPTDTMNSDAVGHAVLGTEGGDTVTAAHRTLPLPSYVEVTSLDTGKTILVRVERRGPMSGKGLIELSPGAAAQLGMVGAASDAVRVRRVNPIEQDRAVLRLGQAAPARMDTPKSLLTVLSRKLDQQEGVVRPVPVVEPTPEPTPAPVSQQVVRRHVTRIPEAAPRRIIPVASPTPVLSRSAAPAPAPTLAPAAVPAPAQAAHGSFFVQVGAFSSRDNAQSAASKIGGGVSASGKLWRVRTGPFANEGQAKAALAKAKAAGYGDARIQRSN